MLYKRESFFLCEYKSKFILVGGGFNGMNSLDSVELYNIRLNKWSVLNVRLPKIDKSIGLESVGLSINTSNTSNNVDELWIFGGT